MSTTAAAARTTTLTATEAMHTELLLRLDAMVAMAAYPQYAGHFDGYSLVQVTENYATKGGPSFTAGEYALAAPADYPGYRTVWSNVRNVDVSVFDDVVLDVVRVA